MVDFCEAEYSLLISPMFFTQRKLRFHEKRSRCSPALKSPTWEVRNNAFSKIGSFEAARNNCLVGVAAYVRFIPQTIVFSK